MDNIVSYAQTKLETFGERPFCAVDSLILSWLVYFRLPEGLSQARTWEGMRLADMFRAECFGAMFHGVWDPDSSKALLTAVVASPRFRDARICGFTEQLDAQAEKQFAAATFRLAPGLTHVSFRGTDSTVVGWKEDFNLAFKCPVASQQAAAEYVRAVAGQTDGPIVVGGHSKGGNLAVYAAAKCGRDVQGRIERAYSHDGPGFRAGQLESDDFRAVELRVEKVIPQSSVVGLLLEQHERYRIVTSSQKSILQHDPFSWEVDGVDFKPFGQLTFDARYLDKTLSGWIGGLSDAERERLTDALFDILSTNDIQTMQEIADDWQKNIPAIARTLASMDPGTRSFLVKLLRQLGNLAVANVPAILKDDFDHSTREFGERAMGRIGEMTDEMAERASGMVNDLLGRPGGRSADSHTADGHTADGRALDADAGAEVLSGPEPAGAR